MELEEFGTSEQRLFPKDALQDIYNSCKSVELKDNVDRQRRGYVFQNLLHSLLYYEGLAPRTSYRPKGEEIDGSFYLNHRTFLMEARWRAEPTAASDTYSFKTKVDGKLLGTIGVFISMSGYSEDTPEALEKGKTPIIILFDQSDMDVIFIHGSKFVDVLDFKLRQAGEVGKTYVPFGLRKEIAEVETKEVVVSTTQTIKPRGIPLSTQFGMTEFAQLDVGFGELLVLVLCEGNTEVMILENIFRRLLDAELIYPDVVLEIKNLGAGLKSLKKLPEIINIVQHSSRRQLSGVVLVLDAESLDYSRVSEIGEQVSEYIGQTAMPVRFHLSLITQSLETCIGLEKGSTKSGVKGLRIVKEAVHKINLDELCGDTIKNMLKFIQEVTEPEDIWVADARRAVERFLEEVEWDTEKGVVWLPVPPELQHKLTLQPKSIESREDFHCELVEVAMNGAANSMPYEDGEPVFHIDYYDLVDEILIDTYEEQMIEMGWW